MEFKERLWAIGGGTQNLTHGGDEKSKSVARIRLWGEIKPSCPSASAHPFSPEGDLLNGLPGPSSALPTVTRARAPGEMTTAHKSEHSLSS